MSSYFRNVPNIDYINRNFESISSLNQYITTKNLFKRVKLRDDIFGNLNFFEKYQIIGDERPDNVAYKVYNDEVLDWIILLSNNIINVQSEWPLSQVAFDAYLFEKYGAGISNKDAVYDKIYNGFHHYESIRTTTSKGAVVLEGGIRFTPGEGEGFPNFKLNFLDTSSTGTVNKVSLSGDKIFRKVTNYEYEANLEEQKRGIYVLKPQYLNIIFNDIDRVMPYVEGSEQYVGPFLKKVDDIRLYS